MRINNILFPCYAMKGKVFGGGGGGGGDSTTDAQRMMAHNSALAWNRYVDSYIPQVETPYIEDIIAEPTDRINRVQGEINADVAKQTAPAINPSGATFDANAAFTPAKANAAGQVSGKQAVETQRLAAMQGIVDIGRGKQSNVDTALNGLAKSEAETALSNAANDFNTSAAWGNAIGSGAGAVANFANNYGSNTPSTTPANTTTNPTAKPSTTATGFKLQ